MIGAELAGGQALQMTVASFGRHEPKALTRFLGLPGQTPDWQDELNARAGTNTKWDDPIGSSRFAFTRIELDCCVPIRLTPTPTRYRFGPILRGRCNRASA